MSKILISIPTYNGGELWANAVEALKENDNFDYFVIDSSSSDNTVEKSKEITSNIKVIKSQNFNHGGTRNLAVKYATEHNYEFVVFITQDSILQKGSIEKLGVYFEDLDVAAVCARQLPHHDANPIAAHARYFNYPETSQIKSKDTVSKYGIKSVFMSNSFSAYRVRYLNEVGLFPENTILCEDMFVAGKLIKNDYKNVYAADAVCKHSHNYGPVDEFKRYFDIGVFHDMEPWIRDEFGGAGGEGLRFIISEFKFLLKRAPLYLPLAALNNLAKILGMKLGGKHRALPLWLNRKLSMHKSFWK